MSVNIQLKRYNGSVDVITHPETNWGQVVDKPTTFTPTSHTHPYLADTHDASNVTSTLRSQWSAGYTHSISTHAPSNAVAAGATGDAHAGTAHAPSNADNTAANETSHADVVVDSDVSEAATANKIIKRNSSGYAFAQIFNQKYATNNTNIGNFMTQISADDGYIRPTSLASAKTAIVTKAAIEAVLTGSITSHTHNYNNYTLPAAASSTLGGIKARVSGNTLYLRNDGNPA